MKKALTILFTLITSLIFACTPNASHFIEEDEPVIDSTNTVYVTPRAVKINLDEFVVLDGKKYHIPRQWQGERVKATTITVLIGACEHE